LASTQVSTFADDAKPQHRCRRATASQPQSVVVTRCQCMFLCSRQHSN